MMTTTPILFFSLLTPTVRVCGLNGRPLDKHVAKAQCVTGVHVHVYALWL